MNIQEQLSTALQLAVTHLLNQKTCSPDNFFHIIGALSQSPDEEKVDHILSMVVQSGRLAMSDLFEYGIPTERLDKVTQLLSCSSYTSLSSNV